MVSVLQPGNTTCNTPQPEPFGADVVYGY